MQNWILVICSSVIFAWPMSLNAQSAKEDTVQHKYFISSTLFVLANLIPDDNSPEFAQLNFGLRLRPQDAVSIELKTWTYRWPLGIPYGPSNEVPNEKFPGSIKEYGFALVYQHFWWKGLYSAAHVMCAWQNFRDESDKKFDDGFQIFNTYRLGYHFKFFNGRVFIEPSLAVTHRPFHSEMPENFKLLDEKWPKFFIGEPGIHVGFNF